MSVAADIEAKLRRAFQPDALDIVDDSARHAGHAAMKGLDRGETHFRVVITADAFAGKSRLERQRMVYAALAEELAGPVHALELVIRAPGE